MPSFNFQLRVRTFDLGSPSLEQSQQAIVTVNVIRNNVAPQFILTPYATSKDLTLSFIFQLRVRTFDLGSPSLEQSQQAIVTVNVIRNNAAPQFILTPYATTISKDLTVSDTVYTVTATDLDFNSFSNVSTVAITKTTLCNEQQIFTAVNNIQLTHLSLASLLWDIGKQHNPR